jgi:hypothetical protein
VLLRTVRDARGGFSPHVTNSGSLDFGVFSGAGAELCAMLKALSRHVTVHTTRFREVGENTAGL